MKSKLKDYIQGANFHIELPGKQIAYVLTVPLIVHLLGIYNDYMKYVHFDPYHLTLTMSSYSSFLFYVTADSIIALSVITVSLFTITPCYSSFCYMTVCFSSMCHSRFPLGMGIQL